MAQGFRSPRHIPAYSSRGFFGFMARADAPVESFTASTCSHVLPPSLERNTPRSGFFPKACPSAAT